MKNRAERSSAYTTELLEPRRLLDAAASAAIEQLSLSPAVFVQNAGQWTDPAVRFVHQGKGASIAITDAGPVFELYRDVTDNPEFANPEVGQMDLAWIEVAARFAQGENYAL